LPKEEIQGFMRNISEKENMRLSESQIETIQRLYRSDIRSMINFMQLNNEYGGGNVAKKKHTGMNLNIISDMVWETIYQMLAKGSNAMLVIQYIHDASIQYNIDKRTILTSYFEYTIRNKSHLITCDYLKVVEDIVHIHDDVPMENILMYFCNCMLDLLKTSVDIETTTAEVSCV
jgi:DNA polymerase III delta prime subunit